MACDTRSSPGVWAAFSSSISAVGRSTADHRRASRRANDGYQSTDGQNGGRDATALVPPAGRTCQIGPWTDAGAQVVRATTLGNRIVRVVDGRWRRIDRRPTSFSATRASRREGGPRPKAALSAPAAADDDADDATAFLAIPTRLRIVASSLLSRQRRSTPIANPIRTSWWWCLVDDDGDSRPFASIRGDN